MINCTIAVKNACYFCLASPRRPVGFVRHAFKTILYIPQADGITSQKLPRLLRCIMFDHFGIHQNVPTQELFELFINYYKFYKQAICYRLLCYRPLYLPVLV